MIFFYHPQAGERELICRDDQYHSLVRVRRVREGDSLQLQNCMDSKEHDYLVTEIQKKQIILTLQSSQKGVRTNKQKTHIHLGWGICDAKTVYSTLPFLNQLGVGKISFVACSRSQGNIVLSDEKIQKILISSCEQSGRSTFMQWEYISIAEYMKKYPESYISDFNGAEWKENELSAQKSVLVGPEGGFTEEERNMFKKERIRSLNTSLVLKSETACITLASSVLL